MREKSVQTALVCYTQGAFDNLAPTETGQTASLDAFQSAALELEIDSLEAANLEELVAGSRQVAILAANLTSALQSLQVEAEVVKVPLSGYTVRDLAKAAFAWRLLDLTESNGRPIDLVICLDFPAWSVSHPHKVCWLFSLPFFVSRQQVAPFWQQSKKTANGSNDLADETATSIHTLLQAEKRGLSEARRVLAAQRQVAEELARSGLQVEFNPPPRDPTADASAEEWQKVARRFL